MQTIVLNIDLGISEEFTIELGTPVLTTSAKLFKFSLISQGLRKG